MSFGFIQELRDQPLPISRLYQYREIPSADERKTSLGPDDARFVDRYLSPQFDLLPSECPTALSKFSCTALSLGELALL
jgi:hypothetical protein